MTQEYTGLEFEEPQYREALKDMAFAYVCSINGASQIATQIENNHESLEGLFRDRIETLREIVLSESRVYILSLTKTGVPATSAACLLPDLKDPKFFELMIEGFLGDLTTEERVVFLLLRLPSEDYQTVAAAMNKGSVYDLLSLLDAAEKKIAKRVTATSWQEINAERNQQIVTLEIADSDFATYAKVYDQQWRFGVEEIAYTLVADEWSAKIIADRVAEEAHEQNINEWSGIFKICVRECKAYIVGDLHELKWSPSARMNDPWAAGLNALDVTERQCVLLASFFYTQSDDDISEIASMLKISNPEVRELLKTAWQKNIKSSLLGKMWG